MSKSSAITNWVEAAKPEINLAAPRRDNYGLRQLLWLYFWLLIFEGVLRKWVAPSLASAILIIRDPIPILMLWMGVRNRVVPRTLAFWLWGILAVASLIAGFMALPSFPMIVLYGFRCDFLHLPVLFITPLILERSDLVKFVRATLVVSVPIALLMVYQFRSPPDSWINSGIDGTFKQMGLSTTHIRPPGPFSFAIGPYCYFSLSAACLIGGAVDRFGISRKVLIVGAIALILAAAFCGSRNLLANVAVVAMTGMIAAATVNPQVFRRYVGAVLVFGVIALGFSTAGFVQEGTEVLSSRISQASASEGGTSGFLDRFFGSFTHVAPEIPRVPILGMGLGVGTMGASAYLSSDSNHGFLISEEEWPRVVEESGPVIGLLFIGFRVALVTWLGWVAFGAVRRGSTLALCLFGACALNLLVGAFGQATLMGYSMLTGGLCLSAARIARAQDDGIDGGSSPNLEAASP